MQLILDESNYDAALKAQQTVFFNDWLIYNENGDGDLHILTGVAVQDLHSNGNDI
jgi:hypothetical protein